MPDKLPGTQASLRAESGFAGGVTHSSQVEGGGEAGRGRGEGSIRLEESTDQQGHLNIHPSFCHLGSTGPTQDSRASPRTLAGLQPLQGLQSRAGLIMLWSVPAPRFHFKKGGHSFEYIGQSNHTRTFTTHAQAHIPHRHTHADSHHTHTHRHIHHIRTHTHTHHTHTQAHTPHRRTHAHSPHTHRHIHHTGAHTHSCTCKHCLKDPRKAFTHQNLDTDLILQKKQLT